MQLVPIFVDETTHEGLYALRYHEGQPDEIERILKNWNDTNYVFSYFLLNEEYLKDDYFLNIDIFQLVEKVHNESREILSRLEKYKNNGYQLDGQKLQKMFMPLEIDKKNFIYNEELQKSKSVLYKKSNFPQPILRLYGLREEENIFIVTGGAIKLTHLMENHPDTKDELKKLELVKSWLVQNNITTHDDINYWYEEQ